MDIPSYMRPEAHRRKPPPRRRSARENQRLFGQILDYAVEVGWPGRNLRDIEHKLRYAKALRALQAYHDALGRRPG